MLTGNYMNLKQAKAHHKLSEFIAEREKTHPKASKHHFHAVIKSMASCRHAGVLTIDTNAAFILFASRSLLRRVGMGGWFGWGGGGRGRAFHFGQGELLGRGGGQAMVGCQ
jgi:hypothetical protein